MIERRTLPLNFFDFLLVLLVGLLALTVLKKPNSADAAINPKAEYIVELSWDDRAKSDIDLWFRAPTGEVVNFINKQQNLYSLDRDDLGDTNDTIRQADGTQKIVYINHEMLTIRGMFPGAYTINVQVFKWKDDKPINATVRMIRLNPYKLLFEQKMDLEAEGQEITAAIVYLDIRGDLARLDYTQVSLVRRAG